MVTTQQRWLAIIGGVAGVIIVIFTLTLTDLGQKDQSLKPHVVSTDPILGNESANVTLVVFADFECDACKAEVTVLKRVLASNQKDIRLVFKDFPMPSHVNARQASEISRCAQDQGKFWQMHDALFKHQIELDTVSLEVLATEAGADASKLDACMKAGSGAARVDAAIAEGTRLQVQEVPTLFVNTQRLTGILDESELIQAIQKAKK
jgi:protein-disulfide isomerase